MVDTDALLWFFIRRDYRSWGCLSSCGRMLCRCQLWVRHRGYRRPSPIIVWTCPDEFTQLVTAFSAIRFMPVSKTMCLELKPCVSLNYDYLLIVVGKYMQKSTFCSIGGRGRIQRSIVNKFHEMLCRYEPNIYCGIAYSDTILWRFRAPKKAVT